MGLAAQFRSRGPYPLWLTAAAAAFSTLVTFLVLCPELYVLTVTATRALFVWFTWYGDIFVHAQELLKTAPWIPVPFLLVVGTLITRRLTVTVVKRWRPPYRGKRSAWVHVMRAAVGLALLPSALGLTALLVLPIVSHGAGYYTTGGGRLQRDRCSKCHSPYRPFHFLKTRELYKTTVHRMRVLEGAPITQQEEAKIAAYLGDRASLSDGWIFRAKCLRCHSKSRISDRPRSAEEWRLIISRVARISPYAYRLDWRGQVERYAAQELSQRPAAAESQRHSDKVAFERVCGSCHELSLSLSLKPARRAEVVRLMLNKVPSLASAEDEKGILRFLQNPPTETKETQAMFPHDKLVWPKW